MNRYVIKIFDIILRMYIQYEEFPGRYYDRKLK